MAEKLVELVYDEWGQFDEILRYADLDATKLVAETELEYDDLGRVTDISHERADTILAQYNLTWDAAGRLVEFDFDSLVGGDGDTDYTYDETGQLTNVDYDSDWQTDESYTYDDNGNRTVAGYETGDHNRLMEDGTYRYAYDNEGNRILRYVDDGDDVFDDGDTLITEYEWDHRNRLVSVADYATYAAYVAATPVPSQAVEYTYDAFDQLIGRALDSDGDGDVDTANAYVQENGQIVLQYEYATGSAGVSDLSHRYLWGTSVDELLADEVVDDGGEEDVRWTLADHLNSIRDWVVYNPATDTVSVDKHVVYDAYGNVTSDTTPGVSSLFLYTGRLFDETAGLQNNLHRWYDPSTGTWLGTDPISFAAGETNLYCYCANSPLNWTDPLGLDSSYSNSRGNSGSEAGVNDPTQKNRTERDRERRRWSDRNFWRGWNLSLFDERGKEILGWWLNGSGNPFYRCEGEWGRYMRANALLRDQIAKQLAKDALTRCDSGPVDIRFHAEIENGYLTGYEMLHGTNAKVGDFEIRGYAKVVNDKFCDGRTIKYDVKFVWNDITDPAPKTYEGDAFLAGLLKMFYNPKDYDVHISWIDQSTIEIFRGVIQSTSGYPFIGDAAIHPFEPESDLEYYEIPEDENDDDPWWL